MIGPYQHLSCTDAMHHDASRAYAGSWNNTACTVGSLSCTAPWILMRVLASVEAP